MTLQQTAITRKTTSFSQWKSIQETRQPLHDSGMWATGSISKRSDSTKPVTTALADTCSSLLHSSWVNAWVRWSPHAAQFFSLRMFSNTFLPLSLPWYSCPYNWCMKPENPLQSLRESEFYRRMEGFCDTVVFWYKWRTRLPENHCSIRCFLLVYLNLKIRGLVHLLHLALTMP